MRYSSQKRTKIKPKWKRLKTVNTRIKRSRILQKTGKKAPKTPKGPSSVEDIKVKMQASIEKGGSLPKVEAKFFNYVKNCFRMTDQDYSRSLAVEEVSLRKQFKQFVKNFPSYFISVTVDIWLSFLQCRVRTFPTVSDKCCPRSIAKNALSKMPVQFLKMELPPLLGF